MLYALVHILDAPYHIDKPYTYNLPTQLEKKVKVGSIVVVPFGGGNKHKLGVVTQLADKTDVEKTKPVLGVPGGYMYIDSEMLGICMYMKEQLFCSLGDAVSCVLPSGLGVSKVKVYSVTDKKITKDINVNASALYVSAVLIREKSVSETRLSAEFGRAAISCMRFLEKEGYCTSTEEYECKVNEKNEKYVCLVQDEKIARAIAQGDIKLTPKQNSVFEILLHYEAPCPIAELCDISGAGVSVVNEIVKKGVARFITVDYDRNQKLLNEYSSKHYDNSFTLSEMQKNALEQLVALYETHEAKCALLYGVTGSGKTNVMLKLIEKVLSDGKKVIMLVPEIALTSQTVGRFKAYFGDSIALVHSGLGA